MDVFFTGFSLGLGLILAIGAQNAFVLKQGLRREHVFWVCSICALSDAVLIAAGVFGFAALVRGLPQIEPLARYGGAAFLAYYGTRSLWSAYHNHAALQVHNDTGSTLSTAILTCLAFTWLNPHVYLDTLMLLGSISTQYPQSQVAFALGAMSASLCFFFALGYGARLLTPLFAKPLSWRILDAGIGVMMWSIALSLLR